MKTFFVATIAAVASAIDIEWAAAGQHQHYQPHIPYKPDFQKPEIAKPEFMRPDIQKPEFNPKDFGAPYQPHYGHYHQQQHE